jgi:hypothetical protein
MGRYTHWLRVLGSAVALASSAIVAQAAETNCTACTPPTGVLGYRWFTARGGSSFTCRLGSQTITQNYTSLLVGFKADGTIGALRVGASGFNEILISGTDTCDVKF